MSFQPQQQQQQLPQQQQQPVVVYPNTVTGQAPPASHHSNGSFGSVFIVLAVIIVVSAIACFLGRLCNRRYRNQKPKQNPNFRPKESGSGPGDIEFGFDKRFAAGPAGININGGSKARKPFENVDHIKGGKKHADQHVSFFPLGIFAGF